MMEFSNKWGRKKVIKCCFCGKELQTEYTEDSTKWVNNPFPLASVDNYCCTDCNNKLVIPARKGLLTEAEVQKLRQAVKDQREIKAALQREIKKNDEVVENVKRTLAEIETFLKNGVLLSDENANLLEEICFYTGKNKSWLVNEMLTEALKKILEEVKADSEKIEPEELEEMKPEEWKEPDTNSLEDLDIE